MKELAKRISVAAWGIPLILGLSYLGGIYFLILLMVINSMALWEFYTMFREKDVNAFRVPGVLLSSLLLLGAYLLPVGSFFALFLFVMFLLLLRHLYLGETLPSANTVFTLGGILYISLFLSTGIRLQQELTLHQHQAAEQHPGWFWILLWASIWLCDTAAYFAGRTLGKHKLSPRTSPNKTVEGAVAGLLAAVIVFWLAGKWLLPAFPALQTITSGLIVGIFGQMGDLVESRFKRDAGVKDTSSLLPGHGGFLDRFDSFIFVLPLFYILFYLIRILN